jgi:hypothetical protein
MKFLEGSPDVPDDLIHTVMDGDVVCMAQLSPEESGLRTDKAKWSWVFS